MRCAAQWCRLRRTNGRARRYALGLPGQQHAAVRRCDATDRLQQQAVDLPGFRIRQQVGRTSVRFEAQRQPSENERAGAWYQGRAIAEPPRNSKAERRGTGFRSFTRPSRPRTLSRTLTARTALHGPRSAPSTARVTLATSSLTGRGIANDGRGAGGCEHAEGLLGSLLVAQHLECVVHAAAGELTHLLHHFAIPGIDDVGGAKLGREPQFRGIGVDRDDAAGAADLGALIAAMPTPPRCPCGSSRSHSHPPASARQRTRDCGTSSFSGLFHCSRLEVPSSIFTVVSVQSTVRPVVQLSQVPLNTERQVTT